MSTTAAMVRQLKENQDDYEWYPTTTAMIDAIKADMEKDAIHGCASVLDVGAGDGRVLRALTDGEKYAIEKSKTLLSAIKHDVFVVGTDFHQQTLLDKRVSVIVSNPPYKEYEEWARKIIKEGNVKEAIYLVIPKRWEKSAVIRKALDARNVDTEIIYEGDFLDAERQARAKVHVVKVLVNVKSKYTAREWVHLRNDPDFKKPKLARDPFDVWFDEHFKIEASKDKLSEWERKERSRSEMKQNLTHEIVEKKGVIEALVDFYNRDLNKLMQTYQSLADVDGDLLSELDVNLEGVKAALRQRITGLKDIYWRELFDRLESVTSRLTSNSRESMLDKLFSQTSVDFSIDNAHALALWVVKNANLYLDAQLIETVEKMVNSANIEAYVSNQRTFRDEDWRYSRTRNDWSHFKLDHRVVLSNIGGIKRNWFDGSSEGLENSAERFLDDLSTVAGNIGFDTAGMQRCNFFHWDSNVKNVFSFRDAKTGKFVTLFEAKAFKNGNIHIKFNQKFICALNCEFGRLKGWLKSREQAAQELDIDISKTSQFGSNTQLLPQDLTPQIGFSQAA